jgi:hypothetical protein
MKDAELNLKFMEAFDKGDVGLCNSIDRELKENYSRFKKGNL